ncbi:5-deoxy-glucuronate isomerase [Streptomyces sp. NBC_01483]|uniref:5-deoxy-glucuronate isomerase n=1 Tax=Streptomyces sp. NBC_01483 TaxID=2903883 RepID=UPI002E370B49|nr:5-deoxy-glucuronate isomerase [Streptomyces sp. NBC_01483]
MTDPRTHSATDATRSEGLYVPKGATAGGLYAVDIDPKRAGWTHSSLRVVELGPGGTHTFTTGDSEWIVLPLGGACTVRIEDEEFQILGRESVFAGVSDFAYVPRDARAQIASGAGGRFALAGAKCERRLPARYGPAPEVPVEDRGSGKCARQVRNFASADVFECDKLIAVEVITPGGNWSSYPPHKHDEHRPGVESQLEEIYYFEIDGPNGFGYQRVFPSREGGSDVLAEVRTGDAVLVPDGWHGPSIAQPGHTMYYLNVMAGPGEDREWRICFHPDHVNNTASTEGYR